MRTIRFFDKEHDCRVKKEHNILARRWPGFIQIEAKARTELWLFCPWCGEQLSEFVEAEERLGEFHIYETNSDRSRDIPARGEYIDSNCGQTMLVGQIWHNKSDVEPKEICPECLLQRRLVQPKFRFFLRGKVEKPAPTTP